MQKKSPDEKFKVLSFTLPPEMEAELSEAAVESRRPRAELIREALREYLDAHPVNGRSRGPKKQSVLAVVEDGDSSSQGHEAVGAGPIGRRARSMRRAGPGNPSMLRDGRANVAQSVEQRFRKTVPQIPQAA
jgi:Arc/MetJ-type ribon-helix-helix transcriptional regulator